MNTVSQLQVDVTLQCQPFQLEVDTGAGDNFLSLEDWKKLGSPNLQSQQIYHKSATHYPIDIMGTCELLTKFGDQQEKKLQFVISRIPNLNLLGRDGIQQLRVSVDSLMQPTDGEDINKDVHNVNLNLKESCKKLTM